jgi:hypothetical protein
MDQRLKITDLNFNFSCPTQKRAEFARTPTDEGWLVLAFKMMPTGTRTIEARNDPRTIGCDSGPQRFLINQYKGTRGNSLRANSRSRAFSSPP